MRRIFIFLFFLTSSNSEIFAQDFHKSIAFSNNVIMDFINEYSLYIDIIPFKYHSFGICIGDIYDNKQFDPRPLSPSQNNQPGTVYKGYVARIYYNYYFFNKDYKRMKFGVYLSPQIIYKNLYYNNKTFYDENTTKYTSITYTRNEKTNITGFDLVCGLFISFKIFKSNEYFFFNPYVGPGYNKRYRNIETLNIIDNHYKGDKPVLGKEIKNTAYFTIVFGFKVGILLSNKTILIKRKL